MNIISNTLLTLSLSAFVAFASAADEAKVDVATLPAELQAAIKAQGDVKSVHAVERDGKTVYHAQVKVGDKTENIWLDEKGGVIKDNDKDASKAADKAADKADKAADKADKAADKAEIKADKAEAKADKAEAKADKAEAKADKAEAKADKADAKKSKK